MITVIQNGNIITSSDSYTADILVENGKIKQIGETLKVPENAKVIDASGKYVLPGMIDQHTHVESPFGGQMTAPWNTESVAAAMGGTTTIVDFALQTKGDTLINGVKTWQDRANGRSAIDYGFHIGVTDLREDTIEEIPSLVEYGVPTLKLFMAYKNDLMIDDDTMYRTLVAAKKVGALVFVHAENGDIIDVLQKECVEAGNTEPYYHAVSRPVEVETEATSRAVLIAEAAKSPIFVVHVSAKEPADTIREAKARGVSVYAETCPHYLFLTKEELKKPNFEGAKYVCSPPLRDGKHHDYLWKALGDDTLETIGSDHCSFFFKEQKEQGRDDFRRIPNGGNGIEHRFSMIYTYGVNQGRVSMNRLVDLLSTTPAKINGLFPQKGTIAIGSDADIVIFDPNTKQTITHETSHQGTDYDMFEGFETEGKVTDVLLRGKQIVENAKYVGSLGDGQFTKRTPFGMAYDTLISE